MKFKVGDKVRLKSGLKIGEEYGHITFREGMKAEGTITVEALNGERLVCIDGWNYSVEMLELLPISILNNGCFCRDRKGDIYIWLYGQMYSDEPILTEIMFDDDLKSRCGKDFDIMEIRQPITGLGFNVTELFANFDKMELVWKRESEVKDKAIEMLNDVISECEKTMEAAKATAENARQTIRKIEEGDIDALL